MDDGEAKRDSRSRPATPPPPAARNDDDLGPDLAFAMSLLQEEEEQEEQEVQEERDRRPAAAMLSTIESEMEEEEEEEEEASDEESSDCSNEEDRYFYSLGNAFDVELGFPEGEDSGPSDIYMAELDNIDPDELSYEELIELGEIIGEEKRGLSLEQIGKCFRPYTFRSRSLAETKNGAIDSLASKEEEQEGSRPRMGSTLALSKL
ncbi:E3 ubiquitin ligase BIG BROTHER-related-like [Rhodamnia argentea]|uniref:E3 ubiquitin ligase BIG BROTHER-related-like n=1 Tax=Rhodamnia argentea TaxID=178133 RepID=A0ABM3H1E1_9MYRT|nr:E3 ubiquitin ligase BIG BROTHER-related-like [Rhodamnia argentea]